MTPCSFKSAACSVVSMTLVVISMILMILLSEISLNINDNHIGFLRNVVGPQDSIQHVPCPATANVTVVHSIDVASNDALPTRSTPDSNNTQRLSNTSTVSCTAEVLFKDVEHAVSTIGWKFSNDEEKWQWQVPIQAQKSCHLDSPFVTPLESSPKDIHDALNGKWLLMIGDSSIRMLHDYLIGRWLGNYTHWPAHLTNHGSSEHTYLCFHGPEGGTCHYDVFHRGVRVTFVWLDIHMNDGLQNILSRTVGLPDIVVGQHGYWEMFNLNQMKESANSTTNTQEDIQSSLENAASIPKQITEVLENHQEMGKEYQHAYNDTPTTYKLWMSYYNENYMKSVNLNHTLANFDAHRTAKELGWDSFDRSKLVNIEGKHVGPHPMDEVLEIELELLLLLIRNAPGN
mmetsp:Transcript_27416/g.33910  ORF Transcript_27416/g.33910 Transcript_27416/m.33910 type:complete len:401 (+) Transcript_27416:234-1436(+)